MLADVFSEFVKSPGRQMVIGRRSRKLKPPPDLTLDQRFSATLGLFLLKSTDSIFRPPLITLYISLKLFWFFSNRVEVPFSNAFKNKIIQVDNGNLCFFFTEIFPHWD